MEDATRLQLQSKCTDLIANLKRAQQTILDLHYQLQDNGLDYQGIMSGSEFQFMSERLNMEAENLERRNIDVYDAASSAHSSDPRTTSSTNTSSDQSSVIPNSNLVNTTKQYLIGPMDVGSSILSSIMSRKPKEVKVPEERNEAAITVERILSTGYANENGTEADLPISLNASETEDGEGGGGQDDSLIENQGSLTPPSSENLRDVEVRVTAIIGRTQSIDEDTESTDYGQSTSQFLTKDKLVDLIQKLEELDRKLAELENNKTPLSPTMDEAAVDEKEKVATMSQGTQVDRKAGDEPILMRQQKDAGTLTSKQWKDEKTVSNYNTRKKRGESSLIESQVPNRTKEVDKMKFRYNSNQDAEYWKEKATKVLKALVDSDVQGMEFLSNELDRLPSPTRRDLTLPCQDQHGYWATQANTMFVILLKQKRCNPAVWNALTPYAHLEEALGHLTKERKR